MNRAIHSQIRRVRHRFCFVSKMSRTSVCICVTANTFRMTFASTWLSVVDVVLISAGHKSRTSNQGGPFHHKFLFSMVLLRLPRSAGLSLVLKRHHF